MVNYIYNPLGYIEYAVVPYVLWQQLQEYMPEEVKKQICSPTLPFDPNQYRGILKDLGGDIDNELKNLRDEWNRTTW
ncbi:MAG: hypothetical protein RIS47_1288 [Bacteroidota bacterium]|jgi:hypothetical protein